MVHAVEELVEIDLAVAVLIDRRDHLVRLFVRVLRPQQLKKIVVGNVPLVVEIHFIECLAQALLVVPSALSHRRCVRRREEEEKKKGWGECR